MPALQILNDNRIVSIATVRPDGWMLLAQRHPNLTDLAPPQNDEVETMVAEPLYVSVLDYSRGLGYSESLTLE